MSTAAYRLWDSRGRPYRVASPIAGLVGYARGMGIPILGVLGNEAHLTADRPQDHTPYPANPWPGKLDGYVVTACDLGNGPHANALLDAAKNGRAEWVKYLNFGGKHYDVRNNWVPTSSDDEHLHASCRSDYTYRQLTENPLIRQRIDDMTPAQIEQMFSILERLDGRTTTLLYDVDVNEWNIEGEANAVKLRQVAQFDSVVAKLEAIEARIAALESGSVGGVALEDLRIVEKGSE